MAGGMQVLPGLSGIGRYVSFLPHIFMIGFLSGIGARILWTQAASIVPSGLDDLAIVAISLAVMLLWPNRIGKFIPGPLAGIAAGIVLSIFLPGAVFLDAAPTGLPVPVISIPSLDVLAGAVGPAAVLALLSTGYTLMLAVTADTFTGGQHNANRQLVFLGIANVTAGVVGTMPGSGNLATLTVIRHGGPPCHGRHFHCAASCRPAGILWPLCFVGARRRAVRRHSACRAEPDRMTNFAQDHHDQGGFRRCHACHNGAGNFC